MRHNISNTCAISLWTLLLVSPLSAAQTTYQDCLLEASRAGAVKSKRDIGLIRESCREQFPETATDILGEKLEQEEIDRLDMWTHRDGKNNIKGSIYNGNPDLVITQLTLLITPKGGGDNIKNFFDSEEFEINVRVPPYKSEAFVIDVEKTDIKGEFGWTIISVRGY